MPLASEAPQPGRLITFEGVEGAGKSTQIRRLHERLREAGVETVATREPGGSEGAEILRRILLSGALKPLGARAEAILFAAARIDHIDALIRPALARGHWVLSDRFIDSTRAYQGAAEAVDPRLISALERAALGGLRPDLTLIIDLPAQEGLRRAAARRGAGEGADRFEGEDVSFHEAVRNAFLAIAETDPARCVVIDGTAAEARAADEIWSVVRERLLAGEEAAHGA